VEFPIFVFVFKTALIPTYQL